MKRRTRPRPAPSRRTPGRWLSPRRLLPLAAALLAAVALVAQTGRTVDRIRGSKELRVVTMVSREMERAGKSPPQLVAGNLRLLREAARLDPTTVGVPVALAGQYMLLERYDSAVDLYREALEIEARPEIYLNLGNALFVSGRREEAREAYRNAVLLAPRLRRLVPAEMRR